VKSDLNLEGDESDRVAGEGVNVRLDGEGGFFGETFGDPVKYDFGLIAALSGKEFSM